MYKPRYPGLYYFDNFTFTSMGNSGHRGPTPDQRYADAPWREGDFSIKNGQQSWTVPANGTYRITAAGAYGAAPGRVVSGDVALYQGQTLRMLVGQEPTPLTANVADNVTVGGGGGTFVTTDDTPLIVASGGDGGSYFTGYVQTELAVPNTYLLFVSMSADGSVYSINEISLLTFLSTVKVYRYSVGVWASEFTTPPLPALINVTKLSGDGNTLTINGSSNSVTVYEYTLMNNQYVWQGPYYITGSLWSTVAPGQQISYDGNTVVVSVQDVAYNWHVHVCTKNQDRTWNIQQLSNPVDGFIGSASPISAISGDGMSICVADGYLFSEPSNVWVYTQTNGVWSQAVPFTSLGISVQVSEISMSYNGQVIAFFYGDLNQSPRVGCLRVFDNGTLTKNTTFPWILAQYPPGWVQLSYDGTLILVTLVTGKILITPSSQITIYDDTTGFPLPTGSMNSTGTRIVSPVFGFTYFFDAGGSGASGSFLPSGSGVGVSGAGYLTDGTVTNPFFGFLAPKAYVNGGYGNAYEYGTLPYQGGFGGGQSPLNKKTSLTYVSGYKQIRPTIPVNDIGLQSMALSEDANTFIASWGNYTNVYTYNGTSWAVNTVSFSATDVAISADGSVWLIGGVVWRNGSIETALQAYSPPGGSPGVAISSDGNTVAIIYGQVSGGGDFDRTVYMNVYSYSNMTWTTTPLFSNNPYQSFPSRMCSLSADGNTLVMSYSSYVYVYRRTNGTWSAPQQIYENTSSGGSYVNVNNDGSVITIGDEGGLSFQYSNGVLSSEKTFDPYNVAFSRTNPNLYTWARLRKVYVPYISLEVDVNVTSTSISLIRMGSNVVALSAQLSPISISFLDIYDPTTTCTAVTSVPHGYPYNYEVQISGTQYFDGTWLTTTTSPTSFTFQAFGGPTLGSTGTTVDRVLALSSTNPVPNVLLESNNAGTSWTTGTLPSVDLTNAFMYGLAYVNNVFVTSTIYLRSGASIVSESTDGRTWTSSSPVSGFLVNFEYINGLYIACAVYSASGFYSSSDGVSWTPISGSPSGNFFLIAHGQNKLVAITSGNSPLSATTTDGTSWSSPVSVPGQNWQSLTFGNGLFVACGGATPYLFMKSSDGSNWTLIDPSLSSTDYFYGITFGNGTFVAVGYEYNVQQISIIATSTDTVQWTKITLTGTVLQAVTFANGTFIACGYDGIVYTSTDAITWSLRSTLNSANFRFIAYGYYNSPPPSNSIGTVSGTVTGVSGGGGYTGSPGTGASGATCYADASVQNFTDLGATGNTSGYVTVELVNPPPIQKSTTLNKVWTTQYDPFIPTQSQAAAITYGNGTYVVVTKNGTYPVLYSTDGITWYKSTSGTVVAPWCAVAYGNSLFVALASDGTSMTSSDSVNWSVTYRYPTWSGIAYGNGVFVGVANGYEPAAWYSADGVTWSYGNLSMDTWSAVSYGNGVFTALTNSGTVPYAYSYDGITWSSTAAGFSNLVSSVAGIPYANGSAADGPATVARFNSAQGLVYDGNGNLLICDTSNRTIRKLVISTGVVTTAAGLAGAAGTYDGFGSGARFNNPSDIAYAGNGNFYISDSAFYANNKIRKLRYGPEGWFVSTIGTVPAYIRGIAYDGVGSLYICASEEATIRKFNILTGVVTIFAGLANVPGSSDGIGSNARFSYPTYITYDGAGNLYISDTENYTIRKLVIATAEVTTIAGLAGVAGSSDGTGSSARFYYPLGLTYDGNGNLYINDSLNYTIRKLVISTAAVTTVAGGGSSWRDAAGMNARFMWPQGITYDRTGNLYITDFWIIGFGSMIRKLQVSPPPSPFPPSPPAPPTPPSGMFTSWTGSTYGNGTFVAVSASGQTMYSQTGISWTLGTNIGVSANCITAGDGYFVVPSGNSSVSNAMISTDSVSWSNVTLTYGSTYYTGAAYGAAGFVIVSPTIYGFGLIPIFFFNPNQINNEQRLNATAWAQLAYGNKVFVAGGQGLIQSTTDGVNWTRTVVSNAITSVTYSRDLGTFLAFGNVFVDGTYTSHDGVTWTQNAPLGLTVPNATAHVVWGRDKYVAVLENDSNVLYSRDGSNWNVTTDGTVKGPWTTPAYGNGQFVALRNISVSTLAGLAGSQGSEDGIGSDARFRNPENITSDGAGNLYVCDTNNCTIRKLVISTGEVTTIAGTAGVFGFNDGIGPAAQFVYPEGITYGGDGNLYICDTGNQTIRKLVIATANVTTIAGLAGGGPGSADGIGSNARFNSPRSLACDGLGILYITDTLNSTIRKLVISTARVTTIAGQVGVYSYYDGIGTTALFNMPAGIVYGGDGYVYVSDTENNLIRKFNRGADYPTVTTVAGVNTPHGITPDGAGNLYVCSKNAETINKIVLSTGVVMTIAGAGQGSQDGPGSSAQFFWPWGIVYGGDGNLYVSDSYNCTIRKIGISLQYMVSTNGINWTFGSATSIRDIIFVTYGNGVFVAVGYGGAAFSKNGTTWTQSANAPQISWFSVAYGNGYFIAVSLSGAVMYSYDGNTWYMNMSGAASLPWGSVAFGGNTFLAIERNGASSMQTYVTETF